MSIVCIFPSSALTSNGIVEFLKQQRIIHKVIGITSNNEYNDTTNHLLFDHVLYNAPTVTSTTYEWKETLTKLECTHFIPSNDKAVELAAKLSEEIPNIHFMCPTEHVTQIIHSKYNTYELLPNISPKVYTTSNKLYIKPDHGHSAIGCRQIDLEPGSIVCEVLEGDEFTVQCFDNEIIGIRKRSSVTNGLSILTHPIHETPHIINVILMEIIGNLSFHNIPWFFQVKDNRLLEIQARIPGAGSSELFFWYSNSIIRWIWTTLTKTTNQVNMKNLCSITPIQSLKSLSTIPKYKSISKYTAIAVDLDDTLIINNKVNHELIGSLYSIKSHNIPIYMITKHNSEDLLNYLQKYAIHTLLFDDIIHIKPYQKKRDVIHKLCYNSNILLIDDSQTEREEWLYDAIHPNIASTILLDKSLFEQHEYKQHKLSLYDTESYKLIGKPSIYSNLSYIPLRNHIDVLKKKTVSYISCGDSTLLDIGPDKFPSKFNNITVETLDIIESKDITYVGDITRYVPIERDRFNVIFCCDVFEHTLYGSSMFVELNRILKPGGILLFTVPYMFRLHGPAQDMVRISPQWFKKTFVDVFNYKILHFSYNEVDGTNLEPIHWGMILEKPPGNIPQVSWALHKGTSALASQYLNESYQKQQFSNFGPLVMQLESRVSEEIAVKNVSVVTCCNATVGLDMLVKAYQKSRIAVQSFTFVSDYMNSLSNTYIVPLRQDGKCGPDLNLIPKDTELLVVTNCFNYMHKSTIREYTEFCKINNIILLFDFATQTDLKDITEIGDGAVISLHDTKPLGRGEGGLIIVPSNIGKKVRSLIALGKNMTEHSDIQLGTNGKMSEIQAAYILDWWDIWYKYVQNDFIKRFNELRNIVTERGIKFMFPNETMEHQLPNVIAIQCTLDKQKSELSRIPVRKYYKPLCDTDEFAANLYENCICIPVLPHVDINEYLNIFAFIS